MKKLFILPLLFLSFGVSANERIFLSSYEHETADRDHFILSQESSQNGVGLRFFEFRDSNLYWGVGFSYATGNREYQLEPEWWHEGQTSSTPTSYEINEVIVSGDVGRSFGNWTPFIGASYTTREESLYRFSLADNTWELNAGVWFENEMFKLRGALNDFDNSDNRQIFGNILFKFGENYVFGAEGGLVLNDAEDRVSFAIQLGRSF